MDIDYISGKTIRDKTRQHLQKPRKDYEVHGISVQYTGQHFPVIDLGSCKNLYGHTERTASRYHICGRIVAHHHGYLSATVAGTEIPDYIFRIAAVS